MVAKQELVSLQFENKNEQKEAKKIIQQEEIANKVEQISAMETNLSSKFEEVIVTEKQNNDSLFSSVENLLTPELLVDADFLSAKYYNDQAQKQYVKAQDLKNEAVNTNDLNEKAELLREAHQYELAAVENQQDALNLLDEIEVPVQSDDLSLENETVSEVEETTTVNTPEETQVNSIADNNETIEENLVNENETTTEVVENTPENTPEETLVNSTEQNNETIEENLVNENETTTEVVENTPENTPEETLVNSTADNNETIGENPIQENETTTEVVENTPERNTSKQYRTKQRNYRGESS